MLRYFFKRFSRTSIARFCNHRRRPKRCILKFYRQSVQALFALCMCVCVYQFGPLTLLLCAQCAEPVCCICLHTSAGYSVLACREWSLHPLPRRCWLSALVSFPSFVQSWECDRLCRFWSCSVRYEPPLVCLDVFIDSGTERTNRAFIQPLAIDISIYRITVKATDRE